MDALAHDKEKKKKIFIDSAKERIEETSGYIFPDEETTDFALMYVPSEAVYYFLITETSLLEFAQKKRVFIVGPNTIYAYLKTIAIGFQALKIEGKAKEIYASLRTLDQDLRLLLENHATLGMHLRNASAKYDDVRKGIENISLKLSNMNKEK
jgi:DNA recombination protein RmuC